MNSKPWTRNPKCY